jgi:hypothetical protein
MAADDSKKKKKAKKSSGASAKPAAAAANAPAKDGAADNRKMVMGALIAAVAVAAVLPFACEDKASEPTTPQRAPDRANPGATVGGPASGKPRAEPPPDDAPAGELKWTKPAAWKEVPSASAMRKATYQVAPAEGDKEPAEMTVLIAGGSTEANVERWEGQFGGAKAKTSLKSPNGLQVTIVEIRGEYAGGGPMMGGGSGDKKAEYMLLAAIVDLPGEIHEFFKMTGPKKTVEAARKDFDALVDSMTK